MNEQPESAMHSYYQGGDEHAYFRSLLPAFAMACLQGGGGDRQWIRLENHLDGCTSCREELEQLLQLLDDTYTGALEAEIERPVPDLAYLPPWSTPQQPHALVAVVHTMTVAVRQVVIQFTDMLTSAMQQPRLAGEFRSEGKAVESSSGQEDQALPEEYRYQLQGESQDDLVVAIDFKLIDGGRQLYRVKVTVIDNDQDPFSQDGHRVKMHYEAQAAEGITDSSGSASFDGIPYAALPQLQITINLRPTT